MTPTLLVFLAGMAGSMHCIGMCGGFVCALGAGRRGAAANLGRQLLYNLGRVGTYVFMGALLGQLGARIAEPGSLAQRGLALIAGVLMVVVGLQFAGLLEHARPLNGFAQRLVAPLRGLIEAPGPAAPLALGVLNGWLPCPLVYAFAAEAAASGSALAGAATMTAFGLGTIVAMGSLGALVAWRQHRSNGLVTVAAPGQPLRAAPRWRIAGVRAAGGFVLLLGLVTFWRGAQPGGAEWLIALCT